MSYGWTVSVLALSLLAPFFQSQQVTVVQAGTGWSWRGQKLVPGQSIPAEADLTGAASAVNLVLDCQTLHWRAYACKGGPCTVGVCAERAPGVKVLTVYPPAMGILSVIPSAEWLVKTFLVREASSPVILAARATGGTNDAVLLLDEKGVHWGRAFRRVLEGSHCFRVTHLGSASSTHTFNIQWDRRVNAEGAVPVQDLTPGGYLLVQGRGDTCAADPDANPAWVVIAPSSRFPELQVEWQKTEEWIDMLDAQDADSPTLTTVRHAVLAAMAELLEAK